MIAPADQHPTARPRSQQTDAADASAMQALVAGIHAELIQSLEITSQGPVDASQLASQLRPLAAELCRRRAAHVSGEQLEQLIAAVMSEIVGLGPLDPLMDDPLVSDILVNRADEVFVERLGRLEPTGIRFADDQHLLRIIQRIVSRVGRRIDEGSPMVDARLPDGSRVNAIIPPLALGGPTLSIRRFAARPLSLDSLTDSGSLLSEMAVFLKAAVEARVSFLIAGGTGAGKTTLLNALSAHIPAEERVVTIEDSAELRLHHQHVISLETRPTNSAGTGGVTSRDLVRNSLRMRPDRIIVGEVRGAEAMDMLQAMNTGHEGSMSTIHANDTADALGRLEMMVAMTGFDLPVHVVRQYIGAAIKLIVYVSRLRGGQRRVTRISEVIAVENGEFRLADIFVFQQEGVDAAGDAFGHFSITGYRPACLQRLHEAGVTLPENMFAARRTCDPQAPSPAPRPMAAPMPMAAHVPTPVLQPIAAPLPTPAPAALPLSLDLSSGEILIAPPRPSGVMRSRQQ